MKKTLSLMALLLIAMCSFSTQAKQDALTPAHAFSGTSQGDGSLKIVFRKPRRYHVDSFGQVQGDGTFRLDQAIVFVGKPAQKRHWTIRETAPLHYAGTLSDASGPVTGHAVGARLSLHYRVKGVLVMDQTLQLMPDNKTIDNVGRITFLGIPIGSLHELITRTTP